MTDCTILNVHFTYVAAIIVGIKRVFVMALWCGVNHNTQICHLQKWFLGGYYNEIQNNLSKKSVASAPPEQSQI